MPQSAAFTYDYMLIDIDNSDLLNNFDVYSSKKNYFVTSFDLYALKKEAMEVLGQRYFNSKWYSKNNESIFSNLMSHI